MRRGARLRKINVANRVHMGGVARNGDLKIFRAIGKGKASRADYLCGGITIMKNYDLIVIGSGPGGYVAAIRAAQLGLKTALVEKNASLGGTCLNVGCIPSKALLDSSENFHKAQHQFAEHGIDVANLQLDFPRMIARKQEVVDQTVAGIDYLMGKNNIDVLKGTGALVDANTVSVGDEKYRGDKILIATGSVVSDLPFAKPDGKRIITSTEALSLTKLPKSMVVIGGGVIGLELGSVYARLGTEVHVIEYQDSILPTMDRTLGKELGRSLKKLGIKLHLRHAVKSVAGTGRSVTVIADDKKGVEKTFKADYCLVAVGRKAFTGGLGLESVGVTLDERGRIPVNADLQTSVPNIYAIGDVVAGAMLAHKAEEEGVYAVEHMAGQKPHIDHNLIPGVVYTWPEVAAVGKTEEELKAEGVNYRAGSFPFKASGRARVSMDTDGLIKILVDAETDEMLGVHMVGARAADMIHEAVVAMTYRATAEDVSRMCHAHPTFSEAIKEAALAATGDRALHI